MRRMNVGDLNKVWEVRALKRKPASEDALKMLDRIAKQVQPIMRRHHWRVKLLSEFCPNNPRLLGMNVGGGVHVKLRLRQVNWDHDFIPYDQVLDTMLHELCHNAHGPHNASFYKLWDELRKECEELISQGISGSQAGFDLLGRRLGGFSHQPLVSSLRQTSLAAAQKRATLGSILPSGPNRVGGDSSIMVSLSPIQAAAMAAERRLQDEIWCGSQSAVALDDEENDPNIAENVEFRDESVGGQKTSNDRKRSRELLNSSSATSSDGNLESGVLHKCHSASTSSMVGHETSPKRDRKTSFDPGAVQIDYVGSSSNSTHRGDTVHIPDDSATWECRMCTFFNPPLAPLCAICCTERPQDNDAKKQAWACKFCTLENSVKLDKCTACDQWRYSYGAPMATRGPECVLDS